MLLNDPEWNKWSNCEIARRCKVSDPFVLSLRKSLSANISTDNNSQLRTYTTKHGTTATMMVKSNGNRRQGSMESINSSHPPPSPQPPKPPPVSDYVIGFLTNLDQMSAEQRICCCDRLFDQMSDDELEEALHGIQQRLAAKLQATNDGNSRCKGRGSVKLRIRRGS